MKKKVLSFGYDKQIIDICLSNKISVDNILDPWDYLDEMDEIQCFEKRIFVEDASSPEQALAAVLRNGDNSYDAVFSRYESTLLSASFLGELFTDKNFISPIVATKFRDKSLQKKILNGIVPVTKNYVIDNIKECNIFNIDLKYPMILKPIAGAGTALTFKINSEDELVNKIEDIKTLENPPLTMVLEEFIDGEEWHIDGWLDDNEIQLFTISRYGHPLITSKEGILLESILLHPKDNENLYLYMREFLKKTFNSLGLSKGVFHMEVFNTENGIVFSECAARIGGAMTATIFEYAYNLSLQEVIVKLAIGERVNKKIPINENYVGFGYIPVLSTEINELPSFNDMKKMFPKLEKIQYDWKPGDPLPDVTINTVKRTGIFLVSGCSTEDVQLQINNITTYYSSLIEKNKEIIK